MYSYINTYIHTYTHTYIHQYIHISIHTYINTYIHTLIHTYINKPLNNEPFFFWISFFCVLRIYMEQLDYLRVFDWIARLSYGSMDSCCLKWFTSKCLLFARSLLISNFNVYLKHIVKIIRFDNQSNFQ